MTKRQLFESMMTFLGMEIVCKICLADKCELVLYEEKFCQGSALNKIEISHHYNASAGAVFTESGDIWKAFYGSGPTRPYSNTEWLLNEMYKDAMRSQEES